MTVAARWMQRRLLQCLGAPTGIPFSSKSEPITDVRRQQERNKAKVAELQEELEVQRERNQAKVIQLQQELEVERARNQRAENACHTQRSSHTKKNERHRRRSSHTKNERHSGRSSQREHTGRRSHHQQHCHNHRGDAHYANDEERIRSAEVAQFAPREAEAVPLQPRVNQRIGASSRLCVIS